MKHPIDKFDELMKMLFDDIEYKSTKPIDKDKDIAKPDTDKEIKASQR